MHNCSAKNFCSCAGDVPVAVVDVEGSNDKWRVGHCSLIDLTHLSSGGSGGGWETQFMEEEKVLYNPRGTIAAARMKDRESNSTSIIHVFI